MKENNWTRERHLRAVKELAGAPCPHRYASAPYCAKCVGDRVDRIAFEDSVEETSRKVAQLTLTVAELRDQREQDRDRVSRLEQFLTEVAS